MENVLRWFTRGVHNLHHLCERAGADEARGTFEHVDSQRLHSGEFCASDSMGLTTLPALDLADAPPARMRTPLPSVGCRATVRVGRGFAA